MTRIGSGLRVGGGLKFRNKNIRIQAKKAEINRIIELQKENLISPEDARLRIAQLEAQIQELEFGVPNGESDVEIEQPKEKPPALAAPQEFSPELPINNDAMTANSAETPDGGNEFNEPERKDYGKDDAVSYHANMLKIYHGLG